MGNIKFNRQVMKKLEKDIAKSMPSELEIRGTTVESVARGFRDQLKRAGFEVDMNEARRMAREAMK